METEDIFFYSVSEDYGEFFNFALYPIKLKGKIWPTSEHYFQAQKFVGTPYKETICKAISPMKAAELGRSRKVKLLRDWDSVKDNIMYEAIKAKFTQHTELAELRIRPSQAVFASLIITYPSKRGHVFTRMDTIL